MVSPQLCIMTGIVSLNGPPRIKSQLEEQLEGKRRPTQFGRLMEELGINSISAMSPEAKGRIERLWGTFQDRLLNQLRLDKVDNMQAANHPWRKAFVLHNDRG